MSPPEEVHRKALEQGLEGLQEDMKTLADVTERAIQKAVESLLQGDLNEAQEVLALDREAYALRRVIETTCVNLIALHAPVARDLRAITTSLEITTDLGRSTRLARHISEVTQELAQERIVVPPQLATLTQMAELSTHMVQRAVQAFVYSNVESVRQMAELDDAVDQLHDTLFQEIIERMTDRTLPIPVGARYILVNRFLERISDHAVSIGERVVYMVTGAMPWNPLRRRATGREPSLPPAPVTRDP
jgi:phosphate transport system protein